MAKQTDMPLPPTTRYLGRRVVASYVEPQLPEWSGNPYIEALPPIPIDEDEIIEHLTIVPRLDPRDRNLPVDLRLHKLAVLDRFRQPGPNQLDIFRRLSMILLSGYAGRNPTIKGHFSDIQARAQKYGQRIMQARKSFQPGVYPFLALAESAKQQLYSRL